MLVENIENIENMATIHFKNEDYEVKKVGYPEFMAMGKYITACLPSSNLALTAEIDKAAAYAIRKCCPSFPPLLANEETGVDLDFEDFYHIFTQFQGIYAQQNAIEVTVEETPKMKRARLEKELKELPEE